MREDVHVDRRAAFNEANTKMKVKAASMLAAVCLWLAGCASEAKLGLADTQGFKASGATVVVDYTLPADKELTAAEQTEQQRLRVLEIHRLLQGHGFRPVTADSSDFRIRVVEGVDQDVSGEWTGAIGANVALFTLGLVPAMLDYRNDFHYELWSGQKRIHAIDTPADWTKTMGLISLSSTLSADAAREKARTRAHDSVIRLWIDQGSFE